MNAILAYLDARPLLQLLVILVPLFALCFVAVLALHIAAERKDQSNV